MPSCTGLGEAASVTVKSGPVVPTTVLTLAVLLVEFGSATDEFTEAEPAMIVPFAVALFTFVTSVNVPVVDAAISRLVQTTLPVPPGSGVAHLQPAGAAIDTNVVLAGTGMVNVALSAGLGPAFFTTSV